MRRFPAFIHANRPIHFLSTSLASISTGAIVAATNSSVASAGALGIAICAVITLMVSVEALLIVLLGTSPIGLEQLTNGHRNLLTSYGGFDVASLRLGILVAAGGVVLAVRGLPRRLVWQEKAYAILILWLLASLAISPNVFGGIRYTAKVSALFVAWLAFSCLVRRYGRKVIIRLMLITLALLLLCDYALLAAGLTYSGAGGVARFGGAANAPSAGALSVAILALVALYVWLSDHKRYALILYVLAWGPVLLSVTRIAIAGFLLSSVLLSTLMGRLRQALFIVLLIGLVTVSYAPLRERMAFGSASQSWQAVLSSFQKQGVGGINTEGRLHLWTPLWEQFQHSPVIGSGVGESEAVVGSITDAYAQQAHSDYLAMLVNGGLVAGGLWLLSLGGLAFRFMKRRQITALAAAGIVLYFLTAITDNAVEMYAELGIPLAMLIALAFSHQGDSHYDGASSRGSTGHAVMRHQSEDRPVVQRDSLLGHT